MNGEPAPQRIFLIAGENSGDRLGARLMAAIRRQEPSATMIGIGGPLMQEQGLHSLFPMSDIAVMGVSAVLANLRRLLARIDDATKGVLRENPSVLVMIDAPDFTHRVAKRVRRARPDIPVVGYVSPSVWAWRPGRAAEMRPYTDELMALLPFEPAAHARLGGPPCTYVGHSLLEEAALPEAPAAAQSTPLVLALPGSRRSEIGRLMPVFGAALGLLAARGEKFEVALPVVPHLRDEVAELAAAWPVQPLLLHGEAEKRAAFARARAALAASGTVTLELALAGVPSVVAYKVSLLEEAVVNTMIRLPNYALSNIILGGQVMPELMQRKATAEALGDALSPLLGDTPARRAQLAAFARLRGIMDVDGAPPSERAAAIVLKWAREGRTKLAG